MKRQAVVVGLGQFGMALARSLADDGVEVLAVDQREDRVNTAASFTAEAARFDATDERALAQTSPTKRDVCVCAIGDESKEASIICTALFRQMGARRIVARATDALHHRILLLVGAHEVVNPEQEFGERYAARLLYGGIIDEIPLGRDLAITELKTPKSFCGKTLADLALPKKYGITVIAVRHGTGKEVSMPAPLETLKPDDVLVVVARPGVVAGVLGDL